jgi:hypothetical protein
MTNDEMRIWRQYISRKIPQPDPPTGVPAVECRSVGLSADCAREPAAHRTGARAGPTAASESRFFDIEYAVPEAVIAGRPQLTVRFQAKRTNEVATQPVNGCRLAKDGGRVRHETQRADATVASIP